jgi:hypothetical protein
MSKRVRLSLRLGSAISTAAFATFSIFLAGALFSSPAFGAQNVANTSQKGSLLMWPDITVDVENASDTVVEISNDQNATVQVECEYINQRKGRVDFDFSLSAKQTLSWDVLTGKSDVSFSAPLFPSSGTFPGNASKGDLVCFAVDAGVANQIAWNHLTGTATVIDTDDTDAIQTKQAFRYNAFAFAARCTLCPGGLATDGTIQGTAGDLVLSGNGDGTYDECPAYNIVNFSPNGATVGPLATIDNDLAVISCDQDLRQDFTLNLTKLQFTVWNEFENSFTGSYQCVDSVNFVPLSASDNSALLNPSNFDFSTLRTANARYQVAGVASTQCAGSRPAGLLGVATASVGINDTEEDQELGSTTQGAGGEAGFVLWDPAGIVPFVRRR